MHSAHNTTDQALRHTELASDAFLRPSGSNEATHGVHIDAQSVRSDRVFMPPRAPLFSHVDRILLACPKEEMFGSNAWRGIASVQNAEVSGVGSVCEHERKPVRKHTSSSTLAEDTVSIGHLCANPKPARRSFANLTPESTGSVPGWHVKQAAIASLTPAALAETSCDSRFATRARLHIRNMTTASDSSKGIN